uniref:EGF-like domain-containing protein n=1 Tax=Branchiostoma floridae TaxID=7739 RepID=C3Y903_BRAFL|eukprot:XP_002607049.1 hypothetical protein BRAFLDRAFT_118690 [Branchiostoma floridae]
MQNLRIILKSGLGVLLAIMVASGDALTSILMRLTKLGGVQNFQSIFWNQVAQMIFVLCLTIAVRPKLRRECWKETVVLVSGGILRVAATVCLCLSYLHVLPGNTWSVVYGLGPVLTIGLAALIAKERPNVVQVVGMVICICGVTMVGVSMNAKEANSQTVQQQVLTLLYPLSATSLFTLCWVLLRWLSQRGVPLVTHMFYYSISGILLLPLAYLVEKPGWSFSPELCDFESYRICDYTQDRTDDFDWTRRRGSTITSGTGPTGDHTTGTGYYMHTDGTGQSLGKKARLKSPLIFERGDFCLEFYYHMYGSTVGSLNVYRDSTSNRVWSMSGNQGNAWQKASVDFSSSSSYFQIIFEGVRGSWDNGDIAIDDVEIKNHACGAIPTGTGDCNFESSDICGYTHDRTHDFDWQRHRGSTLSSGTGPSQDHTTGTGYYMYMETTLPATGDKARLVSPAIVGGGTKCLQFWYHMYGSRTGTLAVFNKVYDQTNLGTRLWSLSGNQGDAWKRARVTLTPTASYFQIVFEGTNGGFFSDIAVDDIDVDDGSCRDVNECLVDAQACSPNAQCTNTADGYECTCRPGYSGNGHLCQVKHVLLGRSSCRCLHNQYNICNTGNYHSNKTIDFHSYIISHDLRDIIERNGEVAMDDISDEKLSGNDVSDI